MQYAVYGSYFTLLLVFPSTFCQCGDEVGSHESICPPALWAGGQICQENPGSLDQGIQEGTCRCPQTCYVVVTWRGLQAERLVECA